jgi:hypothetical protein
MPLMASMGLYGSFRKTSGDGHYLIAAVVTPPACVAWLKLLEAWQVW